MATSTVKLNGTTLMTVNDTTAVASDVAQNKYFYGADGVKTAGSASGGGGGSSSGDDVRFYDYDGTLLYSYSAADFANLSAMPANPSHTGLTAQGWNWTLANAKGYVSRNGILDIGQLYTTSDGKTRLYITVDILRPSIDIRFGCTTVGDVSIDWGDNSAVEYSTATAATIYSHTYSASGDYVITLSASTGEITLVGTGSYCILGSNSSTAIYNTSRLKKIHIGDDVSSIGTYIFKNCYDLEYVTIPKGVNVSTNYSFQNCYSLKCFNTPGTITTGWSGFAYCTSLKVFTISDTTEYVGSSVFSNCRNLRSFCSPEGTGSVDRVDNCYLLKRTTLPSTKTQFYQSNEYQYCYSLEGTITIPDGITSISNGAFQGCRNLSEITIGKDVTSIGQSTFNECLGIKNLTLSNKVTSIGQSAFQGCISLESVEINGKITSLPSSVFSGCTMLKHIDITDDSAITSLGASCFASCYTLESFDIPDNVTSIGSSAFSSCYNLITLTIPEDVASIGTSAFAYCYGIKEYHMLPTSPPTLAGTNAFANISSDCIIYVPYSADHSILNAYQTANNWSTYASYMQEEPQ